ncbi:MAG: hypothetical protein NQ127_04505, partial [Candidatus Cardinium sp.]|nr:hypothetical protein [Candidatus Cardinium sp.]
NTGQACQESKPKLEPDSFGTQETYPAIPLKPKPEQLSSNLISQVPSSNISKLADEYEEHKQKIEEYKQKTIASLLGQLDLVVKAGNLLCIAKRGKEENKAIKKIEETMEHIIEKTNDFNPNFTPYVQFFCQSINLALGSEQPERKEKIQAALEMFKKSIKDYCNSLNRL